MFDILCIVFGGPCTPEEQSEYFEFDHLRTSPSLGPTAFHHGVRNFEDLSVSLARSSGMAVGNVVGSDLFCREGGWGQNLVNPFENTETLFEGSLEPPPPRGDLWRWARGRGGI